MPTATSSSLPPRCTIDGRLTLEHPIFADDFSFLQRQTTTATPKLTIPSRAAAGIVFRRGGDRRTASSSRSTARVPTAAATAAPGLGLAIVRGFVEANGGRVWVESLPSQATSFVVELPVER